VRSDPTGFWEAIGGLRSARTLGSLAVVLGCLEAVARLSPLVVGRHVHQPFLYSVERREMPVAGTMVPRTAVWRGNARGARGDLYRGQPVEIAVVGSSTTASTLLSQEETWPEQLRSRLGRVHVDNYARDDAFQKEAARILRHVAVRGRGYDAILVMTHVDEKRRRDREREALHHWGGWAAKDGWVQADWLLVERLKNQLAAEPRLKALAPGRMHERLWRDRERRLAGGVEFVDEVAVIDDTRRRFVQEETRRLLEAAQAAGDRVFLVLQPIAYDEREHPGVARRWMRLFRVPGRPGCFRSHRAVAEEVRAKNRLMAAVAEEMGVEVVDVDGLLRPHLRERDDLFYDRWHFTAEGAALAASYVAAVMRAAARRSAGTAALGEDAR
jgi:hypothetical protein